MPHWLGAAASVRRQWLYVRYKWVLLGMPYGLKGKVNVNVWPMNVVFAMKLDLENCLNGCILEPWELLEGQEQFFVPKEQPRPML